MVCKWQEEKEKLRRKIIELQKGLDAKQALELEIEQKRGTIQVMKHMREENVEVQEKMDAIIKEIKEKEEEMDAVEALNQSLIVRERKSNDELQEARKELINVRYNPFPTANPPTPPKKKKKNLQFKGFVY